jgi:methyltransferase (TIGR00027 family)
MKDDTPSWTAEAAAAIRALESLLPEETRLFEDEFARRFLQPANRVLIVACQASPGLRNAVERMLDRKYPGAPADFICRTRYIDACLNDELERGLDRIIVFGAGYDMRAIRLTRGTRSPQVIEIDHPATQRRKRAIAHDLVRPDLWSRTAWVSHDLSRPINASAALRAVAAGRARAFCVAEGLLSYLPREAVRGIFAWIAATSAPGSRVVFTYADRELVEGRNVINERVKKAGENFTSGWRPDEMADECRGAGLVVEEDLPEAELNERYLTPRGRRLATMQGARIATAVVP